MKVLEKAAREKILSAIKLALSSGAFSFFMALVYSVDGLAGKDAKAYEIQVANLLAEKWSCEYSSVDGLVKARMALAVVRSNVLLLRGSRIRYRWKPTDLNGFMAGAEGVLQED